MEIKDPKFKEGQKVRDIEYGTIFTLTNINSYGFAPMTIYFDSAKECKKAIKTIGEDRIKKYLFGVES